jgi:hypothetical protein
MREHGSCLVPSPTWNTRRTGVLAALITLAGVQCRTARESDRASRAGHYSETESESDGFKWKRLGYSTAQAYLVEEEGGERDRSPETPAAGAGAAAAAGEAVHAEAPGELGGVVRRRGRGRHDQHPGRQAHARTSIYALPAIVQAW